METEIRKEIYENVVDTILSGSEADAVVVIILGDKDGKSFGLMKSAGQLDREAAALAIIEIGKDILEKIISDE